MRKKSKESILKAFFKGWVIVASMVLLLPQSVSAFHVSSDGEEAKAIVMVERQAPGAGSGNVQPLSAAVAAAESGASVKRRFPALEKALGMEVVLVVSKECDSDSLAKKLSSKDGVLASPVVKFTTTGYPSPRKQFGGRSFGTPPVASSNIPNDTFYESGSLWGLDLMKMTDAWDASTGDGSVYSVVMDTGVSLNHRDLVENIGTDLDGNHGFNAVEPDVPTNPYDARKHGTHVAGTVGAVGNNGTGVTGMNWSTSILAVKVLGNNGEGTSETIMAGIDYVLDQKQRGLNIKAVNCSFTAWYGRDTDETTDPYALSMKALSDAGVVIVVASGNEFQNIDNPGGPGSNPKNPEMDYRGKVPWPATMKSVPNIISVSACGERGAPTAFGNYGKNSVHIYAPGFDIYSTTPGDEYESWEGTSMAAPHITGLAALIAAKNPTMGAGAIRSVILSTVSGIPALSDRASSGGIPSPVGALAVKSAGDDPVSGIEINMANINVEKNATRTLVATIRPDTAGNLDVEWSSSDEDVATVDERGVVTGVAEGVSTISVKSVDGGFSAECEVAVKGAAPAPDPWADAGGCNAGTSGKTAFSIMVPLLFLSMKRKIDKRKDAVL